MIKYFLTLLCFLSCKIHDTEKKINSDEKNIYDKIKYLSVYQNKNTEYVILNLNNNKELHITFYRNGNVKEHGVQGKYNSRGTPVDDWFLYDSIGNLLRKTHYKLGSFDVALKEITYFYKNGNVKEIQQFKNDELYEIDSDSIGTWLYYDKLGDLKDKVKFN